MELATLKSQQLQQKNQIDRANQANYLTVIAGI